MAENVLVPAHIARKLFFAIYGPKYISSSSYRSKTLFLAIYGGKVPAHIAHIIISDRMNASVVGLLIWLMAGACPIFAIRSAALHPASAVQARAAIIIFLVFFMV